MTVGRREATQGNESFIFSILRGLFRGSLKHIYTMGKQNGASITSQRGEGAGVVLSLTYSRCLPVEKKTKQKTNQSQSWKNDGVSITVPEETNNILAKLSQHLQISIFRNARPKCQVHASGSSHDQGVNIDFERHSVRSACISFAVSGRRGRRGSLQFSLLKLFVMQIGSAHNILPFDSRFAVHVT